MEVYDSLNDSLTEFVRSQSMFFVASAAAEGRVNLSPKGGDTLRVLGPNRVAYVDLTGSGNETAAHVAQNGRLTIMLCSFGKAPRILRLYGTATVVSPSTPDWSRLLPSFPQIPGARQIISLEFDRVQTSCGYAVPQYELVGERQTLVKWALNKGQQGLVDFRRKWNRASIDGLPAPPLE